MMSIETQKASRLRNASKKSLVKNLDPLVDQRARPYFFLLGAVRLADVAAGFVLGAAARVDDGAFLVVATAC